MNTDHQLKRENILAHICIPYALNGDQLPDLCIADRKYTRLGKGFLLGQSKIVTCLHVLRSKNEGYYKDVTIVLPSVGSFPIETKTFSILNSENDLDIAILAIEPPLLHIENPFEIIINDSSEFIGLECKVNHHDPMDGYCTAHIADQIVDDKLFSANQVDEIKIYVRKGYSGSPVWVRDGDSWNIIGMVRMASANPGEIRKFNFIPSKQIIDYFPNYEGRKLNDHFSRNRQYVRFEEDYNSVMGDLAIDDEEKKIFVLYGPSGIGKTSLARDIYTEFSNQKEFIDCRFVTVLKTFEDKVRRLKHGDLLIIDNLTLDHPLIQDKRWGDIAVDANILITTSNDHLENVLKSFRSSDKRKRQKKNLTGFNNHEALKFLDQNVPDDFFSSKQKELLIKKTNGYPIVLKLLIDIVESSIRTHNIERARNFFLTHVINNDISNSPDAILIKVLKNWIETSGIDSTYKELLKVLSCVSIIGGMNCDILMHILEYDNRKIEVCLRHLANKGYIARSTNPENEKDCETLIVVHDHIKNILQKIDDTALDEYSNKFIKYVNENIADENSIKSNFISKIDALLVEMKNLWINRGKELITIDYFIQKIHARCQELTRLLPKGGSSEKTKWINQLFFSVASTYCYIMIPLAQIIARLDKNEILGRMIWSGTKNIHDHEKSDWLARACCIYSAFSHWVYLDNIDTKRILEDVRLHKDAIYRLEHTPTDIEIGMLLGGICELGFHEEALSIIREERFRNKYKRTQLSILIIITNLHKKAQSELYAFDREKWLRLINELIREHMQHIDESDPKEDLLNYLTQDSSIIVNNVKTKSSSEYYYNIRNERIIGMSRAVALGGHNGKFDSYVKSKRGEICYF